MVTLITTIYWLDPGLMSWFIELLAHSSADVSLYDYVFYKIATYLLLLLSVVLGARAMVSLGSRGAKKVTRYYAYFMGSVVPIAFGLLALSGIFAAYSSNATVQQYLGQGNAQGLAFVGLGLLEMDLIVIVIFSINALVVASLILSSVQIAMGRKAGARISLAGASLVVLVVVYVIYFYLTTLVTSVAESSCSGVCLLTLATLYWLMPAVFGALQIYSGLWRPKR